MQHHQPSTSVDSPGPDALSPAASDVGSLASGFPSASGAAFTPSSASGSGRYGGSLLAGASSLNLASPGGSNSGVAGFNAISTVLNNPHKPSRPIDPSSSRYPPVAATRTDLPKIRRADFDTYLNSVQPAWQKLERSKRLGRSGKARLDAQEGEEAEGEGGSGEEPRTPKQQHGGARQSIEEARSLATGSQRLPPLSAVPQVFFSEEFNLGNPYTFDLVTERYKASSDLQGSSTFGGAAHGDEAPDGGVYDVALNQMLQEKLSWYSDVVEQHLILEISARSSSFFAALGNLQDLEAEAASCLKRTEVLQAELKRRDESEAKAGLRIIREQAARRSISERMAAVGVVQDLVHRRDLAKLLVHSGQFEEALDVICSLMDLLEGRVSLNEWGAGDALPPHLDLELEAVPALADSSALPDTDLGLRNRISPLLTGLVRTGNVDSFVGAYRLVALRSLRGGLRQYLVFKRGEGEEDLDALPALLDDDDLASGRSDARAVPGGAAAAAKLRSLDLVRFLELCDALFKGFLGMLHTMAAHNRVIVHILSAHAPSAKQHSTSSAPRVEIQDDDRSSRQADATGFSTSNTHMPESVSASLPMTLAAVLQEATSLSHALGSRLLSLRSATHVSLDLGSFLEIFHASWSFVLKSETLAGRMIIFHASWSFVLKSEMLAGRMIVGLRGAILNQAKAWLAAFHRERIEGAAKMVEEEMWVQAEVAINDQDEVARIVESATADPKAFILPAPAKDALSDSPIDASTSLKTLSIEEKQYFVVGASTHVLRLLAEYLRVVINLPLLTTEAMGRVVEFLKQFNSRTCQVVLGAGAMRSAGLKNITAKHLALASQSLSIVITLIPYVRETVRRHLSQTQAVMLIEFDKLRRDYQEHQNEIFAKLVAIMSDRLSVHCRGLSAIEWNAPLSSSPPEPSRSVQDLSKETATLHKVLSKYLQPTSVETVMGQVLSAIDKRVAEELAQVEISGSEGRERMREDVALLQRKLGTLKGVTWSNENLAAVLREKSEPIPQSPVTSPPPQTPGTPGTHAYVPRINIFGRRNASAQQQSARPSGETPRSATPSSDAPPRVSASEQLPRETPASTNPADVVITPIDSDQSPSQNSKPRQSTSEDAPEPPSKDTAANATEPSESDRTLQTEDVIQNEASLAAAPSANLHASVTDHGPAMGTQNVEDASLSTQDAERASSEGNGEVAPEGPREAEKVNIDSPEVTAAKATDASASVGAPSSPGAASPSKPARITLKQRLAEAARKRAAAEQPASQFASADSPLTAPIAPAPSETPSEIAKVAAEQEHSTTPQQVTLAASAAEPSSENRDDDVQETGERNGVSEASTGADGIEAGDSSEEAVKPDTEPAESADVEDGATTEPAKESSSIDSLGANDAAHVSGQEGAADSKAAGESTNDDSAESTTTGLAESAQRDGTEEVQPAANAEHLSEESTALRDPARQPEEEAASKE
ncbi:Vacuolar sorting protein VPS45 [Ceraceosorus bombacis]|uniref:Vacuolar sorting protein VPS45 n=1 Tax=Ceraceosorus bombacis TaxID=401625 RepID=A0A0P1BIL4_9BASI|nr:Vacuolar sorting protein VPS45 [Ceraceosorus bombacis]